MNFTHGYDVKLDEKNNPYILFISNLTYKIAKFSPERGWEISEITISDEYGGSGYQNWDTGALDVVNSSYIEAYLIVGGEPKRRGGELQRWASSDGGKTWKKVEDITFNSNGLHNNPQVVVNYSPELKVVWAFVPKNDSSASIIKTYPVELSYALSDECKNPWPYAYLGGRAKSQPIIIQWNNSLIVAVQGMDDGVWIKEWNTTSLTRWYKLSGATIVPPRFSIEENTLWIYVKGKDGNVYKACYIERGKWCNWQKTGKSNIEFGRFGPIVTNSFFVSTDENSRIYIGICTGKPKEWEPPEWIKDLIIYEINPKTFTSSNGPGTGTFKSLKEKLPYLHELGITAIWLAGYSLSDPHHFFNIWTQYACIDPSRIDPSLGTEEDFKDLIQEAHKYGIKVFLDVITHGIMNYSYLIKEHPDWFSGSSWRMIDYNWLNSPPELEQWWINVWTKYVLDFEADGFRLDEGHVRWDLWARIKENAARGGRPIVIISEAPDTDPRGIGVKIGVYDLTLWGDLSASGRTSKYNKYINVKNISSNSLLNLDRSRKYYLLLLSCHDDGKGFPPWPKYNPYQLRGSRFKLGYSFIFTPFIPLFFAGEEFNATYNETPDKVGHGCFPEDPPTNWLYSSQILWNELEIPEKKEFFETFKKAISIRKNEKALTYFSNPPNLINPKKWEPSSLPIPYIRWYENTSILVVGNPYSTPAEVKLEFPIDDLNYTNYNFFKLTDLFSEKEELKYKNEILNFSTIVQPDNFRIFKIEPIIPSLVVNTINKIEEKHVNYQPIQKFVFHTKGGINNGVIYIEKIENLTILPSNILTHTSFKILERNINENIDYVEIVFKIEKDWIKKNNIDQSTIALFRFDGKNWEKLPTIILSSDDSYIYFKSKLIHFSLFVIGGNQASPSETTYTNEGKNIVSTTTTTTVIQSQRTSTTTIAITQPRILNITPNVQTFYKIENFKDVKIYEIEITGREEVKNVEIKVSFLQENEIPISFSEENKVVFVYLKIEINITKNDILNAKVRFIVEKNWIKSNEIDENKINLYRLEDGNWKKLNTRKIDDNENYNYYETDVDSFSLFAIIGEKKSRVRWYFGLVLVTIFIVTMVLIWIFNKTKIEKEYEKLKRKWSSGGFGK